jgi:ParB family chromosome partitioning protein
MSKEEVIKPQINPRLQMVRCSEVIYTKRDRVLNLHNVLELATSIRQVGLLQPPVLNSAHELIAGAHRLEAVKLLGWELIPAIIQREDKLLNLQSQLHENLVRYPLIVLERCEFHWKNKTVHEQRRREGGRNNFAQPGYTTIAAATSGVTNRLIEEEINIAKRLHQDAKELIRDTPVANRKIDLMKLSRMSHEMQLELGVIIRNGAQTLTEAIEQLTPPFVPENETPIAEIELARKFVNSVKKIPFIEQGLSRDTSTALQLVCSAESGEICRKLILIANSIDMSFEYKAVRRSKFIRNKDRGSNGGDVSVAKHRQVEMFAEPDLQNQQG